MGIFSKRPAIDPVEQDRQIQAVKRESVQRNREIHSRIQNGTATPEDKRIFNAGRKPNGHV
ncbi:hypothetical protein [Streptomyces sp. NPDC058694]|uniref:hypothetical protein n=1 Tax=Streptomyces sp. NPDC058694 TaxID=3346603 RepID=UPI00366866B4